MIIVLGLAPGLEVAAIDCDDEAGSENDRDQ
jgi:hypothetical protein